MGKRSREDSEPPSPDSTDTTFEISAISVINPKSYFESDTLSSKIVHLDSQSGVAQQPPEMFCSLPPHRQTVSFPSYEDYEIHYLKDHTNRCTQCRKNFPTEHFLNLHIEENHDSMISVLKERGEKTVSLEKLALLYYSIENMV
jgi:hypothetical protein